MRLIDADALMRDINESLSEMTSIGIAVDGDWLWAKLNDAIEYAPTIEERKKGKWIELTNTNHTYVCSACGRMLVNITDGKNMVMKNYPFCHCGADMRKG